MPKNLTDKIYTIRGQKVMLDYDLAELYGYTTSAFNQQVRRNIEKFEGEEFMFQLTKLELGFLRSNFLISNTGTNTLRSQNVILKNGRGEHSKYLPYAFTDNIKREAYERQNGICAKCGEHFEITEMEADHITPWSQGGKTIAENCQMLCRDCNRRKSDS